MSQIRRQQKGGVSIFIVIFTALLLTVATTSFVQLMLRDQKQASTNDLSQSAYDAAMAGVEDAKRALVMLAKCEGKKSGDDTTCGKVLDAFNANDSTANCEFLADPNIGIATFDDGEVQVGTSDMNQAYTCVRIDPTSPDHKGQLDGSGEGAVIHLRGKSSFDKVRISWFTHDDLVKDDAPGASETQLSSTWSPVGDLPRFGSWATVGKVPPIMRAQLIAFKRGDIDLNRLTSETKTAFLQPYMGDIALEAAWDSHKPVPAGCNDTGGRTYYCAAELRILDLVRSSDSFVQVKNQDIYLQLSSIYGRTHFKVELVNGTTPVEFRGGQATVDSTGRAANLFRRVSARVSVKPSPLKYPEAALSVRQGLCKDLFVTGDWNDYDPGACKDL